MWENARMKRVLLALALVALVTGGVLTWALVRGEGSSTPKPQLACSAALRAVSTTVPALGGSIAVKASGTNGGGCLHG